MAANNHETEELKRLLAEVIPPGTVVAYAGEVLDDGRTPGSLATNAVEVRPGWLLCNGAPVSDKKYKSLFQAIQASHGNGQDSPTPLPGASFNLPDYRGLFLRGVAGVRTDRDPDSSDAQRPFNHPGGNTGNRVGSIQGDATRLPATPFMTNVTGSHTHSESQIIHTGGPDVGGGVAHFRQDGQTGAAGDHMHSVIGGGDNESRAKNAYVHWLIKY